MVLSVLNKLVSLFSLSFSQKSLVKGGWGGGITLPKCFIRVHCCSFYFLSVEFGVIEGYF